MHRLIGPYQLFAMDVCITGINHGTIIKYIHSMCKIKHILMLYMQDLNKK